MKILLCVPVYNNERTIGSVVSRCVAYGYPVLVVNDGSTDATEERARAAGGIIERHEQNKGKGEALKSAFRYAFSNGYTHILTIDGDGQHDPDDIGALLAACEKTPEAIILGVRDMMAIPPKNRFGNRFSNFWVNLAMGTKFEDTQCGLRVYPADLLERHRFFGSRYEFETEALIRHARAKRPIVPVSIRVYYPEDRVSHFVPRRDATRIVFLVMRFLFLLSGCAASASQPVVQAAQTADEEQRRAIEQTSKAFTASQHLRFTDGKNERRADAFFIVYPGKGYRLRVLGPMMVTVFDVSVRCGRYFVELRDKRMGGPLAEAEKDVPFFPVAAVEKLLRPLGAGQWHGDKFVSESGVNAYLERGKEVFTTLELGDELKMRVSEVERVKGVMMPKNVRVELEGRRTLDIENTEIGFDAPSEAEALGSVKCEG